MKILKTICASMLTMLLAATHSFNSYAIEKDIEVKDNTFTITATDFGQLNYIMWTKDRYICEIDGGTYIQKNYDDNYDYITIFLDKDSKEVNIKLLPTGRFRENTEVVVFGDYYLMEEMMINNATIIGDINLDGKNNVADVVMLQSYLLRKNNLSVTEYGRANLNRDENVDIFDMVLMRQKIIRQNRNKT